MTWDSGVCRQDRILLGITVQFRAGNGLASRAILGNAETSFRKAQSYNLTPRPGFSRMKFGTHKADESDVLLLKLVTGQGQLPNFHGIHGIH